ncbi:glycosyltransferase [Pontibacter sp. KCTC 32443]|uniref:glycosyltransferase n=1 Tax=Pontibacter TaxID=323449 RepID=UPI00164E2FB2|nr:MULTISPECIES: glycosyltransferase [Pontibacter]MBC5773491.1 glycosyltransferase [Pontibacter sp. KCTC 32443]
MKVVLVLNHYLPFQVAGTEVYTSLLASFLKSTGHQVDVIIPNYNSAVNNTYSYNGINVHQYAEPSVSNRALIMGKKQPNGLVFFEKLLKELKPDIVHFQELAGSNGITLHHVELAKAHGFKTLMTFHLAGYSCMTGNLMLNGKTPCKGIIEPLVCASCVYTSKNLPLIQKKALTFVSGIFYNLGLDASELNNAIGTAIGYPFIIKRKHQNLMRLTNACDKVVTITDWYKHILLRNGVNPDKISLVTQSLPSFSTNFKKVKNEIPPKIKLVFVGRISHFKGLHLLIEALKKLNSSSVSLDIYGQSSGDEYESYWREESKSCNNIKWCGSIKPGTTVEVLSKYHVLCLPSTFSEMSPLVIKEAFAAGIPVLASNVYGNAEQIQHNVNGLLFDFNKVGSLIQQLMRLLNESQLLSQLKDNIIEPDTFERVGNKYLEIYSELINQ